LFFIKLNNKIQAGTQTASKVGNLRQPHQPSVPVVLILNSLVCTTLFGLAAFLPWPGTGSVKEEPFAWRPYLLHGLGVGLFFAFANTLWYYCVSNNLLGNHFLHLNFTRSIIHDHRTGSMVFVGHAPTLFKEADRMVMQIVLSALILTD
jgi:hypothetical protein